ncbi:MAG: hypothetical protein KDA28_06150 [Phycisphaerales bacterium]|nr:hypothetical protein [Phycisphaerales bacterium]
MKRLLMLPLVLVACSESAPESHVDSGPKDATPSWILTSTPGEAIMVGALKPTAKEGDEVIVRGMIGGRKDAIDEATGTFIIVDPSLMSCSEVSDDDHCPTPWDYCCEPQEDVTAQSATIQLVDASGVPIAIDPASTGIDHDADVVVVGVVAPRPSDAVLVIRATGIRKIN